MKNKGIISEIEAAEKHLADLKNKLNAKKPDLECAEKWLKDYISKPFEMKINTEKQTIIYSRDGVWIFEQDLENKRFWYSDYNLYSDFKDKFRLNFDETEQLITDVVLKHFNCEGLTPTSPQRR